MIPNKIYKTMSIFDDSKTWQRYFSSREKAEKYIEWCHERFMDSPPMDIFELEIDTYEDVDIDQEIARILDKPRLSSIQCLETALIKAEENPSISVYREDGMWRVNYENRDTYTAMNAIDLVRILGAIYYEDEAFGSAKFSVDLYLRQYII